jgi:hypothetical protein
MDGEGKWLWELKVFECFIFGCELSTFVVFIVFISLILLNLGKLF